MKINLKDIQTDIAHNAAFRKRLINTTDNKGKIATMNYAWLEKGKQIETHSHQDGEEFYLFLEGKGKMLVGKDWIKVEKDDFITVPLGSDHSLINEDEEKLTFITLRTIIEN